MATNYALCMQTQELGASWKIPLFARQRPRAWCFVSESNSSMNGSSWLWAFAPLEHDTRLNKTPTKQKRGVHLVWMRNYWSGRNYQIMRSKLLLLRLANELEGEQKSWPSITWSSGLTGLQGNNYWCWRGCVCSSSCVVKMNRIQPRPSFDLEKRSFFCLAHTSCIRGSRNQIRLLVVGFQSSSPFRVYASDILLRVGILLAIIPQWK